MINQKSNFEPLLSQFLDEFGQLISVVYNHYDHDYIMKTSTEMFRYIQHNDCEQLDVLLEKWRTFWSIEPSVIDNEKENALLSFRASYIHCIRAYLGSNQLQYDPMFELNLIFLLLDRTFQKR